MIMSNVKKLLNLNLARFRLPALTGVAWKIPTDISTSSPLFLQGVKKWANFVRIFDPTRIPSALFQNGATYRKSEKLGGCANDMVSGQDSFRHQFLQGLSKNSNFAQVYPILPF